MSGLRRQVSAKLGINCSRWAAVGGLEIVFQSQINDLWLEGAEGRTELAAPPPEVSDSPSLPPPPLHQSAARGGARRGQGRGGARKAREVIHRSALRLARGEGAWCRSISPGLGRRPRLSALPLVGPARARARAPPVPRAAILARLDGEGRTAAGLGAGGTGLPPPPHHERSRRLLQPSAPAGDLGRPSRPAGGPHRRAPHYRQVSAGRGRLLTAASSRSRGAAWGERGGPRLPEGTAAALRRCGSSPERSRGGGGPACARVGGELAPGQPRRSGEGSFCPAWNGGGLQGVGLRGRWLEIAGNVRAWGAGGGRLFGACSSQSLSLCISWGNCGDGWRNVGK